MRHWQCALYDWNTRRCELGFKGLDRNGECEASLDTISIYLDDKMKALRTAVKELEMVVGVFEQRRKEVPPCAST